ncbi:MAG: response regulator [Nitrospirota bacterium]
MEKKILVVDDESHIRRAMEYTLKKAGYNVIVAQNGAEALEIIKGTKEIKLVFLDLMMPNMSGFELCKILKESPHYKHIHIIILTSKGQDSDEVLGFQCGTNEYMTKPFSPSKIVKRVKEILGE